MPATDQTKTLCFEHLCNPEAAFTSPKDILHDADLTTNEKRALLASWASDACAIPAAPTLRQPPNSPPILLDEILEALKQLDREAVRQPDYAQLIGRAARIKGLLRSNDRREPSLFAR